MNTQNLGPAVKYLLGINVAVFVIQHILKIELSDTFAMHHYKSEYFAVYQVVTYMFMHSGIQHLLFNMFGLFSFGPILESLWGTKQFIIFYLLVGVGAALIHVAFTEYDLSKIYTNLQYFQELPSKATLMNLVDKYGLVDMSRENFELMNKIGDNKDIQNQVVSLMNNLIASIQDVPMVGASGAICGLLMAFCFYFPQVELSLMFIPVPIKAWILITLYVVYELYMGIKNYSGDNVAHFAHLGGFVIGFIVLKFLKINQRYR